MLEGSQLKGTKAVVVTIPHRGRGGVADSLDDVLRQARGNEKQPRLVMCGSGVTEPRVRASAAEGFQESSGGPGVNFSTENR